MINFSVIVIFAMKLTAIKLCGITFDGDNNQKMSVVSMGSEYCGMWWRLLFEFLTNLMCSNGGCWLHLRLSYPYIYQSGRTYSGIIEHQVTILGTDITS